MKERIHRYKLSLCRRKTDPRNDHNSSSFNKRPVGRSANKGIGKAQYEFVLSQLGVENIFKASAWGEY